MKAKQRKEGRKEDPRSRRAVVRAFADEKSAGVRAAPRSACSSAGRRAVCGGLLSCLLQRSGVLGLELVGVTTIPTFLLLLLSHLAEEVILSNFLDLDLQPR